MIAISSLFSLLLTNMVTLNQTNSETTCCLITYHFLLLKGLCIIVGQVHKNMVLFIFSAMKLNENFRIFFIANETSLLRFFKLDGMRTDYFPRFLLSIREINNFSLTTSDSCEKWFVFISQGYPMVSEW